MRGLDYPSCARCSTIPLLRVHISQVQVFKEVCRVLKPGCMFGGYEWVVTDKYEPDNEAHVTLKEGIEVGNGLPTLATPAIIKANLEEAGFEVSSRVAGQQAPF